MEIQKMKEKLENEKNTLESELANHGSLNTETNDWQGSSTNGGDNSADPNTVADNIEELGTNVATVEVLEGRLKDVVDALAKIEGDTYGVCEVGGEEIDSERLDANPAARTCIAHA